MKASLHCGRSGSARHNDHTYDVANNDSITKSSENNAYWLVDDNGHFEAVEGGNDAFRNYEKKFYKEMFSDALGAKNERYRNDGHKERCRTMSQVYANKNTQPLELILQVGNKNEPYEDSKKFGVMVQQWTIETMATYPNFRIFDIAIHADETGLHAHARGVFIGHDKDGNAEPNQSVAFKEMGIERPDPNEKSSKNNNALVTWTDDVRTMWQDTIERVDRTVSLDREVTNPSQRHKTKQQYQNELLKNENESLKKLNDSLKSQNTNLTNQIVAIYEDEKYADKGHLDALETFVHMSGVQDEFRAFESEFRASDDATVDDARWDEVLEDIDDVMKAFPTNEIADVITNIEGKIRNGQMPLVVCKLLTIALKLMETVSAIMTKVEEKMQQKSIEKMALNMKSNIDHDDGIYTYE